jgi:hypothetical protein
MQFGFRTVFEVQTQEPNYSHQAAIEHHTCSSITIQTVIPAQAAACAAWARYADYMVNAIVMEVVPPCAGVVPVVDRLL